MSPERFKVVMRHQAATVVIITTDEPVHAGMTATSFTSVSADPPVVLFCVARTASAWPALSVAGHVSVHLMPDNGQDGPVT